MAKFCYLYNLSFSFLCTNINVVPFLRKESNENVITWAFSSQFPEKMLVVFPDKLSSSRLSFSCTPIQGLPKKILGGLIFCTIFQRLDCWLMDDYWLWKAWEKNWGGTLIVKVIIWKSCREASSVEQFTIDCDHLACLKFVTKSWFFFSITNQPKFWFQFHKNVFLCNFYTMTLLIANPKYQDTTIWEGYSYFHYIVHAFQFAEHYF